MIKLGKSRLLCQRIPAGRWDLLLGAIENVDQELLQSSKLTQVSPFIILYGEEESEELFGGREIIGYDGQYKHHEELLVKDYPEVTSSQEREYQFTDLVDLKDKILSPLSELNFSQYRVEINHFETAKVFYF